MATVNPNNTRMNLLRSMLKNRPKSGAIKNSKGTQQLLKFSDTVSFSGRSTTKVDAGAMAKINVTTSHTGGGKVQIGCNYPKGAQMTILPGYEATHDVPLSKAAPKMSEENYVNVR